MKTLEISFRVGGVVAVLMLGLVGVSLQTGLAQSDPFIGTWVLNVAKSTFTPGPPPKSQTSIYEVAGKGVKVTTKGTDKDGKPTSTQFTANYDGKDAAVTGNPDWDATTLKRIDSHTVEFTRKKAGKVVQTGTNVVSKDGKTRTVTTKGSDAKGQQVHNISIYEKK